MPHQNNTQKAKLKIIGTIEWHRQAVKVDRNWHLEYLLHKFEKQQTVY